MTTASKFLLCLLLSGCATTTHKVALPPEVIQVPVLVPLPADCAVLQTIVLPAGATATDVIAQLSAAVKAYNDQVTRCFGGPTSNSTPAHGDFK